MGSSSKESCHPPCQHSWGQQFTSSSLCGYAISYSAPSTGQYSRCRSRWRDIFEKCVCYICPKNLTCFPATDDRHRGPQLPSPLLPLLRVSLVESVQGISEHLVRQVWRRITINSFDCEHHIAVGVPELSMRDALVRKVRFVQISSMSPCPT